MLGDISTSAEAVRKAISEAGRSLVERQALVEIVALAAVAREHALVIGPPGTAKSEAVRRISRALGGQYFEYLLGRFTEPSEIFGPVDLRKLREGVVETETAGMLPEAEIAFLDEIFQGSTAILNTLLGLLNERKFRRGHTDLDCPLRVCVGASNALPDDESLAAFADRFLVRVFLSGVPDPLLEELLQGGWSLNSQAEQCVASIDDLDNLSKAALDADLAAARPMIAKAVRILRKNGVNLSDRRVVKMQRLIAAAGVLAGRVVPDSRDLWPIVFVAPTPEQQVLAKECLRDLLSEAENTTLPVSSEDASHGPRARASRLMQMAHTVLAAEPSSDAGDGFEDWLLKLEGIAREIDAAFAADNMPEGLKDARSRIVQAMAREESLEVQA
ncbi:MAG TPA: AAA family ATPase [Blastocatellia bacterium]|nr:AAA family ATPase [Blastocatellia bacterium]